VRIEKITVERGRLLIELAFDPADPAHTNAQIAARALAAHPTLAAHTCKNGAGPTFGHAINNTPVPHLFEHLVIDAQVRLSQNLTARSFVGYTRWLNASHTRAQVAVNFLDDLIALQAVKTAWAQLAEILQG
jgi:hypothetical protein